MRKIYVVTVEEKCDTPSNQATGINNSLILKGTEEKSESNAKPKSLKHIIEKNIFPVMCMAYLILMFISVIYPQSPLSLFMSMFSFWLVCFYSEYFDAHSLYLHTKNKRDLDIWLWFFTVLCAIASLAVFKIGFKLLSVPFFVKINLNNWLTWSSLVVFVIDKTWSHQEVFKRNEE